jgi:hypothetical protein
MVEVREITMKIKNSLPAQEREDLIKKLRKEDDKMVTGMFEFIDAQGGWIEFTYRKWPGESIKIIRLEHGEICDLPMGLVKQLNNTVKKVRKYNMELAPDGKKVPRSYTRQSRVRFTPTNVL